MIRSTVCKTSRRYLNFKNRKVSKQCKMINTLAKSVWTKEKFKEAEDTFFKWEKGKRLSNTFFFNYPKPKRNGN